MLTLSCCRQIHKYSFLSQENFYYTKPTLYNSHMKVNISYFFLISKVGLCGLQLFEDKWPHSFYLYKYHLYITKSSMSSQVEYNILINSGSLLLTTFDWFPSLHARECKLIDYQFFDWFCVAWNNLFLPFQPTYR